MDDREKLREEYGGEPRNFDDTYYTDTYVLWLEDKVIDEQRHIEEQNLIKQAWIDANKILIKQNKELETELKMILNRTRDERINDR